MPTRERIESTGSSTGNGDTCSTISARAAYGGGSNKPSRRASRTVSGDAAQRQQQALAAAAHAQAYTCTRMRRHSKGAGYHNSISAAVRRNTNATAESGSIALTVVSSQPCFNERSQERRLTRISISIVWLFVFCHMWKLVSFLFVQS